MSTTHSAESDAAYEWAVQFPGSEETLRQGSMAEAEAAAAKYPEHDVAVLRRRVDRIPWTRVNLPGLIPTEYEGHSAGCREWMEAAPGQRGCVCSVAKDVPDDY